MREDLLSEQQARFPEAQKIGLAKTKLIRQPPTLTGLYRVAKQARTPEKKLQWLFRFVDAWGSAIEPHAACRNGCSHCCNISLLINTTEAKHIARITGRVLGVPDDSVRIGVREAIESDKETHIDTARYRGVPCPFLVEGRCSIYAHRPIACRTLFNLDNDDLLCILSSSAAQVVYADNLQVMGYAYSLFPDDDVADIRDFFPSVTGNTLSTEAICPTP